MKHVYLAGPITGLSYEEATRWRTDIADLFAQDIVALDPMRLKSYLAGEQSIGMSYEKSMLSNCKSVLARDRNDVRRCDAVVAYFPKGARPSAGTLVELGWADAWRKPIVLLVDADDPIRKHPLVGGVAGFLATDVREAAVCINALLSDHHED